MLFDQLLQLFIYVRCSGRYRPLKINQAVWQAFQKQHEDTLAYLFEKEMSDKAAPLKQK